MPFFLCTTDSARVIRLDEMYEIDGLNFTSWIVEAINTDIAIHKAKRLDKYSRFIFDPDKLQQIVGLKREKLPGNNKLWSVWF